MIHICIYNETTKEIDFKEEYTNPQDVADPKEREQARLIYEESGRRRLQNETVLLNGASVDEEGRYFTSGPWQFYESTEKQFEFAT
jgi:hypothetical protein